MLQQDKRKKYIELFMLTLAVFFSIVPNVGVSFRVAGLTWTAYRLFAVAAIIFLIVSGRIRLQFQREAIAWKWILFLVIWVTYGALLLLVSRYADRHAGVIELMSVFNGLVICVLLKNLINTEEKMQYTIRLVFWVLAILVAVGLFEMATGHHLRTSGFHDPASSMYAYEDKHYATGFMYNVNDFSSLISCLSPILVSKTLRRYKWAVLCGVIAINLRNDAVTCNLAVIGFFTLYFFLASGKENRKVLLLRTSVILAVATFLFFVVIAGRSLVNQKGILGSLAQKVFAAQQNQGTIASRKTIYMEGLQTITKGNVLGLGPASFPKYFAQNPSVTGLVNPHSLLIEVLVQYGVPMTIVFLFFLGKAAVTAALSAWNTRETFKKNRLILMVGIVIVYFVVSFSPSSFLGYSYQWLLLGIVFTQLDLAGGTACLK